MGLKALYRTMTIRRYIRSIPLVAKGIKNPAIEESTLLNRSIVVIHLSYTLLRGNTSYSSLINSIIP